MHGRLVTAQPLLIAHVSMTAVHPLRHPRPLCETTKIYLERIKLDIIKIKYLC